MFNPALRAEARKMMGICSCPNVVRTHLWLVIRLSACSAIDGWFEGWFEPPDASVLYSEKALCQRNR
jgi:hypothetical protein